MVAKGEPSHSGEKRKKTESLKGKATSPNAGEKECWECGKPGHRKKNLFVFKNKQKKVKGSGQASTSKDSSTQGNHAILIKNSSLNISSINTNLMLCRMILCLGG